MLRRLGIRGKILAVVAVPILVLLLAAGYITYAAASSLNAAANSQQLVTTAQSSQRFQADLNAERDAGTHYVDTFLEGRTNRAGARTAISEAERLLPDYVVADLNDIYATAGAMTLDAARAVSPTGVDVDDPNSWPTWPSKADADGAVASMRAVSEAVAEYGDGLSGDTADAVGTIASQLEQEAAATATYLSLPQQFQDEFLTAADTTDNSYAPFRSQMDDIAVSATNDNVNRQTRLIKEQMNLIGDVRDAVRTVGNSASGVSASYDRIAESVSELLGRFALAAGDSSLSLQLTAYAAMDELFRQLGLESTLNERILRAGEWGTGDLDGARRQSNQTDFARDGAEDAVAALSTELRVPQWGASTTSASSYDFQSVRSIVGSGDEGELKRAQGVPWVEMVETEADAQRPAYDGSIDMAATTAESLRQAALFQTIVTGIAALVVIALSIIIALVIARRIVVPLRRLTTTATAVRAELPRLVERVAMPGETVDLAEVQIPVESRDEVGRLAEAFNGVNTATLAIAAEQAALRGSISEMFVNVARRDQVLLNRQLASIDDMERTQDDPETLTKLFALDHLATRMRRNSESLLVLAGIDTGRRLRRSMPLSDVIRTASSEIELYERVQLELDADPAMLGHSALTAAHLFAELLENATVFSDPGTPVVVRTGERDGTYVVEVQDSGIGMTEAELAEANSRVASTAASEILGAQRLGLFVVGRIARRIGARVFIESKEGEGTTATVIMNTSLFDPTYGADVPHHTESTVDEAMHAPAALVTNKAEDEQFEVSTPAAVAAAAAAAYQPAVVESAAQPDREQSVEELIAADAADAPIAVPVDTVGLTGGVSATGLPTRRRRDSSVEMDEDEAKKIIGLPARATAAQLSALEQANPDEEFKPAIPASEIAPQTPEERAQMFRGFRSRKELGEQAPALDPEAESLGHAARRGGLAPEDIVAAQQAESFVVPSLEDDEFTDTPWRAAEAAPAVIPALEEDDEESGVGLATAAAALAVPVLGAEVVQERPLVVPSLEEDEFERQAAAVPAFDVATPALEPDADLAVEPTVEPTVEPAGESALESATEPAYDSAAVAAAEEVAPSFEQAPSAPAPFSYADVYGSLPTPAAEPTPQPAWSVEAAAAAAVEAAPADGEPSLDELIAGTPTEAAVKASFFGRLFRRGKKDKAPADAAGAAAPEVPQGVPAFDAATLFQGLPAPAPDFQAEPEPAPTAAFEAAPVYEAPAAPAYEAAPEPVPTYEAPAAPAYEAAPEPVPTYEAPAAPAYEATPAYEAAPAFEPAPSYEAAPEFPEPQPAPVSPGGAFALWGSRAAVEPEPAAPAAEQLAVGHEFTPDELANPFGWEAAGASALAASEPEVATEYQPIVDLLPEGGEDGQPVEAEITSAVFSELSSLSAERPKVETTRAGLQRRRSADAPAPLVKPIEPEVQMVHRERDADEVRARFSNFYSGTQRARHDVAEFEQRSQSAAAKE